MARLVPERRAAFGMPLADPARAAGSSGIDSRTPQLHRTLASGHRPMNPDPARKTNLKVLVVEDNPDTRLMLALLLEGDGHDVHTAGSKQAALREFASCARDVLLSDLGLPDGNGWELMRELRQAGLSPFAIAMSGFGTLADVAASRQAGFRHHLVKPIDVYALEQLLEEARREIEGPR